MSSYKLDPALFALGRAGFRAISRSSHSSRWESRSYSNRGTLGNHAGFCDGIRLSVGGIDDVTGDERQHREDGTVDGDGSADAVIEAVLWIAGVDPGSEVVAPSHGGEG